MNRYIVQRWVRVVCLSVWGPILLFLVSPASDKLTNAIGYFGRIPSWFTFISVVLTLGVILVPVLRVIPISWKQFHFFHRYQPVWVAGILGVLWIWFFNSIFGIGAQLVTV